MDGRPLVHFKGTMYDLNLDLRVWGEKIKSTSLCCKGDIAELEANMDLPRMVYDKADLVAKLRKEDIRVFVEKELGEKVPKIKIARIVFDFAEPEDGLCSVDVYLNAGKIFGGFGVHLRLHGDEPRIEMCGLS